MSKIKKLLGQKIKELRKARKITQEQLAEMLGIGTANISYIENGKFAPSMENFEKIIEIFEIEPYELYQFNSTKSLEEMRSELFTYLENNDEMLKLIYKIFKSLK